jgi:hypothetical protein
VSLTWLQVTSRAVGILQPLVLGWTSLASSGLLPKGLNTARAALQVSSWPSAGCSFLHSMVGHLQGAQQRTLGWLSAGGIVRHIWLPPRYNSPTWDSALVHRTYCHTAGHDMCFHVGRCSDLAVRSLLRVVAASSVASGTLPSVIQASHLPHPCPCHQHLFLCIATNSASLYLNYCVPLRSLLEALCEQCKRGAPEPHLSKPQLSAPAMHPFGR